jgi:hypothetical protein
MGGRCDRKYPRTKCRECSSYVVELVVRPTPDNPNIRSFRDTEWPASRHPSLWEEVTVTAMLGAIGAQWPGRQFSGTGWTTNS